jgi:hypothetical protein
VPPATFIKEEEKSPICQAIDPQQGRGQSMTVMATPKFFPTGFNGKTAKQDTFQRMTRA